MAMVSVDYSSPELELRLTAVKVLDAHQYFRCLI